MPRSEGFGWEAYKCSAWTVKTGPIVRLVNGERGAGKERRKTRGES